MRRSVKEGVLEEEEFFYLFIIIMYRWHVYLYNNCMHSITCNLYYIHSVTLLLFIECKHDKHPGWGRIKPVFAWVRIGWRRQRLPDRVKGVKCHQIIFILLKELDHVQLWIELICWSVVPKVNSSFKVCSAP